MKNETGIQVPASGDFTLPGESGYEGLTLELAREWGADVIRDSDGTKLSDDILGAGYTIYSTVCVIREHNEFISAHPDTRQETFLSSEPVMADGEEVCIDPMAGFFREQFEVNDSEDAMRYWQVWDRTQEKTVPEGQWSWDGRRVIIRGAEKWHRYTVSFLAWRVWEEINMYNHTTNHWTSEHLMQLDPRHPEAWAYLKDWMRRWCEEHPATNVVRLTSLFYNFVWIFGDAERLRTRFTDWASYDFTVSPAALDAFREEYGYELCAEDFIRQGKLQATHMPPTAHKKDYMDFIQRFVAEKAKELVDIIHGFGKQAYVFYDDSWVGMEPDGKYFGSVGFDGLIKCIFNGFECRLCAGAKVPAHEIRLHPYLFPVGLGGLPTFSEGGHPEIDAKIYWSRARRALARQTVQRIGLGGYLHLTEGFPEFTKTITEIAEEFRAIKVLHEGGEPEKLNLRVGVVHTWGKLRSWTLSGHFHETNTHDLIHINEALSGLPVDVKFLSFEEIEEGAWQGIDVIINAGRAGDAWSGGDAWKSDKLVEALTQFAYEGGMFIGVGEPSAADGYDHFFRMAHVLGVDEDKGDYVCHGKWQYEAETIPGVSILAEKLKANDRIFLTDGTTRVIGEKDGTPVMTVHDFGKGRGDLSELFPGRRESGAGAA